MHQSRLGVFVIDCKTEDLADAAAFWGAALGQDVKIDDAGKYARVGKNGRYPCVLLQAVDHESRVHMDVETDDREAEAERLKNLGATEIARVKSWIIMEAPTGHRFCLIAPQCDDFPQGAALWNGEG